MASSTDFDHQTGLPRLPSALATLAQQIRSSDDKHVLGVITFAVPADAALHRLLPETTQRLQVEITRRISALLRSKDLLFSIGPWEWLIVLPELMSSAPMVMAMMRLGQCLEVPPLEIDGVSLWLNASCGGATYPEHGRDALYLTQSARIACLAAQKATTTSLMYEASMESVDDQQKTLDNDFALALKLEDGIHLYLQPQIDLISDRCVGAEALLRWERKPKQFVPPPTILASIERQGLRMPFNRWLIQQASQICAQLLERKLDIVLSINLSANDLLEPDLPDMITLGLATWNVPTSRLLLEITETIMVDQTAQVMEVFQRLRNAGLTLSIDDFGTGFSGMTYLKTLPVQEVKIDQIFIRNLANSPADQEIAEATIQLAHRLKMEVIAEGVEDMAARDLLKAMNCDKAQGFYYAKPMPFHEFLAWVDKHHAGLDAQNSTGKTTG